MIATLQQQSCYARPISEFANTFGMPLSDKELIDGIVEWSGLAVSAVARRAGLAVTTLTRPANAGVSHRLSAPTMEKLQAAFPDFPGWTGRPSDQPPTRTADAGETAPVLRLDLSYSMGPGRDLDDSYVEGEAFEFDLGFLRSMTITPPERLRIVDGIGDSMQPTLHDRDLLFVDVNQANLNAQDRIWAIWLFGLGAVKRLRAIDAEKVLVISDNPDVENQIVKRTDILIHGRVVGSIKRH